MSGELSIKNSRVTRGPDTVRVSRVRRDGRRRLECKTSPSVCRLFHSCLSSSAVSSRRCPPRFVPHPFSNPRSLPRRSVPTSSERPLPLSVCRTLLPSYGPCDLVVVPLTRSVIPDSPRPGVVCSETHTPRTTPTESRLRHPAFGPRDRSGSFHRRPVSSSLPPPLSSGVRLT